MHNQSLPDPPAVRATVLLHQEGVLGLIAIIGLGLREGGPLAGLAPAVAPLASLGLGIAAGLAASGVLWLVRGLTPLRLLQEFQHRLVRGWSVTDALSVALLSGLAEEALVRALLQPLIGLLPAALLFAVLHLVPDRRLWLWPVVALLLGLGLGLLYQIGGYPTAAAAHAVVNGIALLRLRTPRRVAPP